MEAGFRRMSWRGSWTVSRAGSEPFTESVTGGWCIYGSYARGEADEGSDVDVLLLLDGDVAMWREYLKAEPVVWPLSLESGCVISLLPVSLEAYQESRKPFLMNARKEGVTLP